MQQGVEGLDDYAHVGTEFRLVLDAQGSHSSHLMKHGTSSNLIGKKNSVTVSIHFTGDVMGTPFLPWPQPWEDTLGALGPRIASPCPH
jgi:hypothetical protein